ncbi:MAG: hypothetical protein RLY93_13585 [Sumerlaeia bacterium]
MLPFLLGWCLWAVSVRAQDAPKPQSGGGLEMDAVLQQAARTGGVVSFLYLEEDLDGHRVRHEMMVPLAILERVVAVDRAATESLDRAERYAAADAIAAAFLDANPVEIEGFEKAPSDIYVTYFDRADVWAALPEPIPADRTLVGIISTYEAGVRAPAEAALTFDRFDAFGVESVQGILMAYDTEPALRLLLPGNPVMAWDNPGVVKDPPAIEPVAATAAEQRLFKGTVAAESEAARAIVERLIQNIYAAFEFRTEEEIYDALAKSIEGELLAQIYLSMRESLLGQQESGAVVRIEGVRLLYGAVVEARGRGDAPEFSYRASWLTEGTVSHWGHKHPRGTISEALLRVTVSDGAWKLSRLRTLSVEAAQ